MSVPKLGKGEANLDEVQNAELTLRRVHAEDKVKRCVVAVYQLVVGATNEATRWGDKCCFMGKITSSFVQCLSELIGEIKEWRPSRLLQLCLHLMGKTVLLHLQSAAHLYWWVTLDVAVTQKRGPGFTATVTPWAAVLVCSILLSTTFWRQI